MKGWYGQSHRHYLAAKGIKTSYYGKKNYLAGPLFKKMLASKEIHFEGTNSEQKYLRKKLEKRPEFVRLLSNRALFGERMPVRQTIIKVGDRAGLVTRKNHPYNTMDVQITIPKYDLEQYSDAVSKSTEDFKPQNTNRSFAHEVGHLVVARKYPGKYGRDAFSTELDADDISKKMFNKSSDELSQKEFIKVYRLTNSEKPAVKMEKVTPIRKRTQNDEFKLKGEVEFKELFKNEGE